MLTCRITLYFCKHTSIIPVCLGNMLCIFQDMASYSIQDLRNLETLAQRYIIDKGRNDAIIDSLYRNKPREYFDEIEGGDGIMRPRVKDSGGDPRCPLNGRLSGLFFFGWTSPYGNRPDQSPFGDRRIVIPINHLFTEGHNLYFADFYCMFNPDHHYVILVVTNPGSVADQFCQGNLLQLNVRVNPYMRVSNGKVYMTMALWVEVFYTEDIDIKRNFSQRGIMFENSTPRYWGQSNPNGIPKNSNCNKCNFPN